MFNYSEIYDKGFVSGIGAERHRFRSVARDGFNALDTPDNRFFKLLFYFQNQNSGSIKYSDETGFENTGSGLLVKDWEYDAQDTPSSSPYYMHNSAYAYLMNNLEVERAEELKQFITLLSNISSESPWYFKEVSGVDEALGRENFKVPEERKKITITCMDDPIDHRISTLLSAYRSIVWSHARKCEVLPANLRKFDMGLFVFSGLTVGPHVQKGGKMGVTFDPESWKDVDVIDNVIKQPKTTTQEPEPEPQIQTAGPEPEPEPTPKKKKKKPEASEYEETKLPGEKYDRWRKRKIGKPEGDADAPSSPADPSGSNPGEPGTDNRPPDPGADFDQLEYTDNISPSTVVGVKSLPDVSNFDPFANSNANSNMVGVRDSAIHTASSKFIEFHNCEISMDSIKSGFGSLTNEDGIKQEFKIDIYFDDCYEMEYNQYLMRSFGDLLLADVGLAVNYYENKEPKQPNSDLPLDKNINESTSYERDSDEFIQAISQSIYPYTKAPISSVKQGESSSEEPKMSWKDRVKQQFVDGLKGLGRSVGQGVKNSALITGKNSADKALNVVGLSGTIENMGLGNFYIKSAAATVTDKLKLEVSSITNKLLGNIGEYANRIINTAQNTMLNVAGSVTNISGNYLKSAVNSLDKIVASGTKSITSIADNAVNKTFESLNKKLTEPTKKLDEKSSQIEQKIQNWKYDTNTKANEKLEEKLHISDQYKGLGVTTLDNQNYDETRNNPDSISKIQSSVNGLGNIGYNNEYQQKDNKNLTDLGTIEDWDEEDRIIAYGSMAERNLGNMNTGKTLVNNL